MGGVSFWYKNSNPGTTAYKTYGTYIQPNGNKRKVTIPVIAGATIKIGVQDAVTVAAEGVSEATIALKAWGTDKDVSKAKAVSKGGVTEIVIWSDLRDEAFTAAKFKLGAIIYDGLPQAIDNTAVEAKATKYMENGALVIVKNGVKYNALGAVIE